MSKNHEKHSSGEESQEGRWERFHRLGRNWNALGAAALGGLAVVVSVGGPALGAIAGINAAQAGGFEALRRRAKKKRQTKNRN